MKKRIVSSIMCLAMLLSLLPVSAFAVDEPTLKLGFEAEAAKADTALGIETSDSAAAHCDPNTMYVLINDAQKDDKYTVKVTKGSTEVWTQPTFTTQAVNGTSKVYFAFGTPQEGHSITSATLSAGEYLFTVTRERAGEVSTRTATLTLTETSGNFTAGSQSAIKDIAFTSTGFAADAERANTALGIASDSAAATKCDPNTMWAKFTLGNTSDITMKVTDKDKKEVYTEALTSTWTKNYFTVDETLVENKEDYTGHSIANSAAEEGTYTFALTTGSGNDSAVLAQTTLTLGKLTVKNSATDVNPTEVFFNTAAKETVGDLIPDLAAPPASDGKPFKGWAEEEGGTIAAADVAAMKALTLTGSKTYVAQFGEPESAPLTVQRAGFAWNYADGNTRTGKTDCLDQTMWLNVTGGDVGTEYFFDVLKGSDVFYSESFMGYGAGESGTPRWSYVHRGQNPGDKVITPGTYTINVYDSEEKTSTPVAKTTVTVPAFPTNDYALTVVADIGTEADKGTITATMPTGLKGRYHVELSKKGTDGKYTPVTGKSFGTEADPNAEAGGLFGTSVNAPIMFNDLTLVADEEYQVAIYQRKAADVAGSPQSPAYVGSALTTGTVKVSNVVIKPAAPVPDFGSDISDEDQAVLTPAIGNSSVSETAMKAAAQAVLNDTSKMPSADEIANATAELGAGNDETVTTVIQPYLAVKATSYTANTSVTYDITPKYRVVVTTDPTDIKTDGSNANAKVVPGYDAKDLTTTGPVEVVIGLPTGFVSKSNGVYPQVYVQHKNYEYTAGVGETDSTELIATFINSHGFSEFTVTKTSSAVAKIGDDVYTSLQEAVNAVPNEGTVVLQKDCAEKVTVSKEVVFTLDLNSKNFTGEIIAGNGYKLDKDGNTYTVSRASGGGGGGGGGVSSNVTVNKATNGKVSVTPTAPSKGATVTINLTPDTGYVVGTVTVTDKDGKAVELTKVSDTKYTFTMPDGKVKVTATFTKADAPTDGFTDVPADAYYADAVKWAVEKGITNGLTATTFGPNNSCTRGQMVTFLWRAAGSPAATGTNSFSDVASGEYYYNAVLWAVEKGITNGTSATTFSPNATVNRGQTVTFLYRYAESPAATGTSSFTDVAADAFYADAVKWAVAEEITNGTSSTTFSPASNCTRGQIVTFMYRQMAE